MEAPRDFGKEAREKERISKEKRKRAGRMIISMVVALAVVVFFWSDIKGAVAPSEKNKKEKTKSGKKDKAQETGDKTDESSLQPASSGITIVKSWELPKVLTEISGLSYIDGDRFACVQDELGTIFIYNTKTSSIEKEIPFSAAGDYEGIAVVNDAAWVVRADGRLFEISSISNGKPSVNEYSTHLTVKHNIEGLCFDRTNNRLLLAIKDAEPGNVSYKGIYSFDLATKKMPVQPVFKIDMQHEIFANESSSKKKAGEIMPSAIAIHPVSKDMYITDGPKSKLLVTDAGGAIKELYQLGSDFTQPEGITFNPAGDMFISNEGAKKAGNILKVEITAH